MSCSALDLGGCLSPVTSWWASVSAWAGWIEFGAGCLAILIVLGLVQRVFGWGGVVAAMGAIAYAIGYLRGERRESFNPVPPVPAQPAAKPPVQSKRK